MTTQGFDLFQSDLALLMTFLEIGGHCSSICFTVRTFWFKILGSWSYIMSIIQMLLLQLDNKHRSREELHIQFQCISG